MPTTPADREPELRFPTVSRRSFLRRSVVVGLAAAAVPALASCGASAMSTPVTDAPGTAGDGTVATDPPSTAAAPALPAGARVQVNFTYEAAGGGRVHSPYIAVWIEDPAGDLVHTVSLWYKSDEGKYLKDLRLWDSKNNRDALTTGATRIPGSFSVAWNGTDLDGALVGAGDYFVCIEAAREDGPYQIIRESIPVSGSLAPTTLTPDGELTSASVELIA